MNLHDYLLESSDVDWSIVLRDRVPPAGRVHGVARELPRGSFRVLRGWLRAHASASLIVQVQQRESTSALARLGRAIHRAIFCSSAGMTPSSTVIYCAP
jgi:hypothetical protein